MNCPRAQDMATRSRVRTTSSRYRMATSSERRCGRPESSEQSGRLSPLFADAEPAEDLAEQIIRRELAGDLAQAHLCEPQLLGEQVERGIGAGGLLRGQRQVLAGAPQRLDVPRA